MTESMIDVNVSLGQWPFRRVFGDEPRGLAAMLRERKVAKAWLGSFEGLFHRDLAGVNARLAADCRTFGAGVFVPFGSINPTLPDWREDLRRCRDEHKMPGIRLHPNYHGYKLDHPAFAELLAEASDAGLLVQLALSMEDERTQHPVFPVPHVDPAPLKPLLERLPKLRVVLINAFRQMNLVEATDLAKTGRVFFDISMLEGANGVQNLIDAIGLDRILFGSHAPFFYWEAARLKVEESGLKPDARRAVLEGNARSLIQTS